MAKSSADKLDNRKAIRCMKKHYQKRKNRYKRKIADLQVEMGKLQERLQLEEALNSKYFDCLEQQGLLCGICMEDIVQDEALSCCNNRLCQSCETKITARHKHCPFCRTPLATAKDDAEKSQSAAGLQLDMSTQPDAALVPGGTGNPFAAALRALMQRSMGSRGEDVDSMDTGNEEYDSDDDQRNGAYDHEQDTTVLLAAAAEAAMTASRGASGTCGLCNSIWLMTSLASAAELPDMLLCRSCWRNIPDLAGKPFLPAAEPRPSAMNLLFGRNTTNAAEHTVAGRGRVEAAEASRQTAAAGNGSDQSVHVQRQSAGSSAATGAPHPTVPTSVSGQPLVPHSSRTFRRPATTARMILKSSKRHSKEAARGSEKRSGPGKSKIKISTGKKIKKAKGKLQKLSLGVQGKSTKHTAVGVSGVAAADAATAAKKSSSKQKMVKKCKPMARV